MADEDNARDVLWKMYEENVTQGRHHETQRTAVSSLILGVAAGILGLIAFDKAITAADVPLTLFLTVLALFGAMFSAKHYERFKSHMERARKYRDGLDQLLPDVDQLFPKTSAFRAELDEILAHSKKPPPTKPVKFLKYAAREKHDSLLPDRLHWYWIEFNLLISALGVLTVWAVVCPQ